MDIVKENFWSGPPGFNCWTSVVPAFQSWFAVEYTSRFISVMNLDLYSFWCFYVKIEIC